MLRTACAVAPPGVEAVLYAGLGVLPQFNPDEDGDALPAAAAELRNQIRAADAVLFSVPEYAGALPGSLKNLLDWSIGDERPGSIYEKPVAWINASSPRRGERSRPAAAGARLRPRRDHRIPRAHIPVTGAMLDDDVLLADAAGRERIEQALTTLATHLGEDDAARSR